MFYFFSARANKNKKQKQKLSPTWFGDMDFLPGQKKSRITHVTHFHTFCAPQKSDMCLKAMLVSTMQNEHNFSKCMTNILIHIADTSIHKLAQTIPCTVNSKCSGNPNKHRHVKLKYSCLSLSRPRLSRITAYLEVKIWSLPIHENLTTDGKYCRKEEKLLLRSNFSSFPQYFQYISNFKSPITYQFVKCG